MPSTPKLNSTSLDFSRMLNIHKAVSMKYGRSKPSRREPVAISMENVEEIKHEWTISVFRKSLREQILHPLRRLKKTNSWLMKVVSGEAQHFKNLETGEANHAFLWAAFLGRIDLMEFCVEKGVNVSFMNENTHFNALHLSAIAGSVECCEWLLGRGCQVVETIDGMTPVNYGVMGNSKEVVRCLIDHGYSIPSTAVNSAVFANAIECVKFLLSLNAEVNAYLDDMTPLHVATDLRHIECVKELLNNNSVNVNLKTKSKECTALHLAAENGYSDCIELLLSKHATIGEVNWKLQTPLHLACKMKHVDCVDILLRNQAPVNEKDSDDKTPLHAALAESLNSLPVVQLLVRWEADVNVADEFGYTPLHTAALNELEECATFLILNGANVAAETKNGLTALNIINRKTPNSVAAIWKRFTKSLAYNTEQHLKFSFRELITNSNVGEIGYLYILQEEGHKSILKHPLCRAFLHLKWEKIKPYYIMRVISVLLMTWILSYHVLSTVMKEHCCEITFMNQTNITNSLNSSAIDFDQNTKEFAEITCIYEDDVQPEFSEDPHDASWETICKVLWYVATVIVILNVIRNLLCKAAYPSFKDYFINALNLLEFVIMLLVFTMHATSHQQSGWVCPWRRPIGTAMIFLTWTYLTLVIGQLPFFGTYITMFSQVFKELLKLLTVYLCLLIGFAFAFSAIFYDEKDMFEDPVVGFSRVLGMMTGELNLVDLVTKKKEDIRRTYILCCVIIFFVVVVTMALMNLLIGIAVSDVEGLQKTADLSKLVHQTKLIYYLELAFFHGYIPEKFTEVFKNCFFVSPKFYRVVMYVKPFNPLEKRLPQDIMEEALQLALDKNKPECENNANDIAYKIEKLESKIKQMCNNSYDLISKVEKLENKISQMCNLISTRA